MLLRTRRLAGAFAREKGGPFGTMGSMDFALGGKRALKVMKRSNDKGDAVTGLVAQLASVARNALGFRKGSVAELGRDRLGRVCKSVRVIFRGPINSFSPEEALNSKVNRDLEGHKVGGTSIRGEMTRLLRRYNLRGRCTGECPCRMDNKRYRQTTVTETLTMRPGILVYSRTADTLSMAVRGRVVRLLRSLGRGGKLSFVFVYRGLTLIRVFYSEILMLCRKGMIRDKVPSSVVGRPGRRCARELISTMLS